MITNQTDFTNALLDPDLPVPNGLVDPKGRPAGKRFGVYRNNVVHSLIEAMCDAFPAIHKIVGDDFFRAMSAIYVRANPPSKPMMMFYGEHLPEFLENFEPASHLGYLPDVARLELARRDSYHAADHTPLDGSILAELSPEDLMKATFEFSPSMALMSSHFPIHSIWHYNLIDNTFKITNSSENVMLTRPEMDVIPYVLDDATHCFIKSLSNGMPLEDALDSANLLSAEFELAGALGLLLSSGILTSIQS